MSQPSLNRQRFFRPQTRRLLRGARLIVGSACLCGLLAASATAESDLDLLLSELTFAQTAAPDDASASTDTAAKEQPLRDPSDSQAIPPAPPAAESVRPAEPLKLSEPSIPAPVRDVPEGLPAAAADSRKRADAASTPEPRAVDFHEVFSQPGVYGSDAVLAHGPHCKGHSQQAGHASVAHRPRQAPVLPPPSNLLDYFRSRPCHSDVWAGYEHEQHAHCQHYHAHLHGFCDCFEPRKKHRPLLHHPASHGCSQCGAPGCDHRR